MAVQLHRVLRLALQQTERLLLLEEEEGGEGEGLVDAKHGEFEREVGGVGCGGMAEGWAD